MKARRSAAVILLLILICVSTLPAVSNAVPSIYADTPPSYLKAGDYVNYTYEFSSNQGGNFSFNQTYEDITVKAINHTNDSIEFLTKTNSTILRGVRNAYSNTSFSNMTFVLPLFNLSFLSSINTTVLRNEFGGASPVAIEKNVTFILGSKHYKTLFMKLVLNLSGVGLSSSQLLLANLSYYIDEKSGLLLHMNISQYKGPDMSSLSFFNSEVVYVSATNFPTTASSSLNSVTSSILSPMVLIFIGLVILIAAIFIYDLRRK